jgi:hypothetical protein
MVVDSQQYTEPQCAGTVKGNQELDGGPTTGIVVENMGNQLTVNQTRYYTAMIRSRSSATGAQGLWHFEMRILSVCWKILLILWGAKLTVLFNPLI